MCRGADELRLNFLLADSWLAVQELSSRYHNQDTCVYVYTYIHSDWVLHSGNLMLSSLTATQLIRGRRWFKHVHTTVPLSAGISCQLPRAKL